MQNKFELYAHTLEEGTTVFHGTNYERLLTDAELMKNKTLSQGFVNAGGRGFYTSLKESDAVMWGSYKSSDCYIHSFTLTAAAKGLRENETGQFAGVSAADGYEFIYTKDNDIKWLISCEQLKSKSVCAVKFIQLQEDEEDAPEEKGNITQKFKGQYKADKAAVTGEEDLGEQDSNRP
ncbi:hypothetical protein [Legionella oakridgensis]|uniref:Uncharacterized protein n=2 Tax=Legionella oakridgensis TaxID=29423 RepID=W0BC56_9GAMM|nr:hypothetical protein [Legionella oakridgensis]AHE66212.1 hypothetical protein Loa_00643 [Legionella oakridgensis ATCC 33761 = DSM 21215]ETO93979.1 hypothetical protein LOR_15c01480 [Legionella oakridgensis RV-2-2007]KTD39734.1 hypothetical protein Loak_0897 [Legionella oakridgensis]STY16118.1 Uncharacterised protein [Legionella longbeachae]